MTASIRGAHSPAIAHETNGDPRAAEASDHAKPDPFASAHHKGKQFCKTKLKSLPKGKLPKAKFTRPSRAPARHSALAHTPAKGALAGAPHPRSLRRPYRDRDSERNGNGSGADSQQDGDDDAHDTQDEDRARKGKFAISRKTQRAIVTLRHPGPLLEFATHAAQGPDRQLSLCHKLVEHLRLVLIEHACDIEQRKRYNLVTPLIIHQATSLPRTRSQSVHAQARLDLLARNASAAGSREIRALLLDWLAVRNVDAGTTDPTNAQYAGVDWPTIKTWLCDTPSHRECTPTHRGDSANTGSDMNGDRPGSAQRTHPRHLLRPI